MALIMALGRALSGPDESSLEAFLRDPVFV